MSTTPTHRWKRFWKSRRGRRLANCLSLIGWLGMLAGCEPEAKVVRYHPMLGGLPGSQSGTPDVRGQSGYIDPTAIPEDKLVVTDPVTKKKTLTARTGRHLMIHIYNAMKDNDKETFVKQILSNETRAECVARGLDPGLYFDELISRQDDVTNLFNAMPSGEFTPGVFVRPLGGKAQRIELDGLAAKGLAYTGINMVMEKGNWKLRSLYEPGD